MSACRTPSSRNFWPAPPRSETDQWNVQWTFHPSNAKRALADVGLDGTEAALDIRDLRSLLASIRFVRRTAVQTTVHIITTGVILALLAGIALKLRFFGPGG